MRLLVVAILNIMVNSQVVSAQTSQQIDTIFFNTFNNLIPTYLVGSNAVDSVKCLESMDFSFIDNGSLIDQEITEVQIQLEGGTVGSVKPSDIEAMISAESGFTSTSTDWLPANATGASTGSFVISALSFTLAADSYNPDEQITFSVAIRRNKSNNNGNPDCGTEEAYVDRWRLIIHYNTDDADNDGYRYGSEDCDDDDPEVNPGIREYCGNGIDDNCNGTIDELPIINYASGENKNIYSLGSIDTCDQLVVTIGTTYDINSSAVLPFGSGIKPIKAHSLSVETGGNLITGGVGCTNSSITGYTCEGDHIDVNTFEIELGATAEIGPNTLIGDGCMFCLIGF